ncbi:MAG: hypothetical protein Q8O03_03560 [Nanoarchaeota archaeon]|nr:hypothetical protein [Nanoarchaeota archaeon]
MLEEKLKAGILTYHSMFGKVQQGRLVSDISDYVHEYELDILLGPEWLFMPETRLYSKEEKQDIVKGLAEKTKTRDTLIIPGSIMWEDDKFFYNTAPIISKGKLIGEQHKWTDGGSKMKACTRSCSKPKYKDFDNPRDVFKWRDYRIGVEICADMGELYHHLEKSELPFLDFYFLVSDGVLISKYEQEIPLKLNGYGLNSDGEGLTIVLRRGKGRFDMQFPKKELKDLKIYELTWEK